LLRENGTDLVFMCALIADYRAPVVAKRACADGAGGSWAPYFHLYHQFDKIARRLAQPRLRRPLFNRRIHPCAFIDLILQSHSLLTFCLEKYIFYYTHLMAIFFLGQGAIFIY
jgi:hypothetical protein